MSVRKLNETIVKIGRKGLERYKGENGDISFPEFFIAYSNIKHTSNGNVTYFTNKNDFENYFSMVEKAYTLATCTEMIVGNNSLNYIRIYQTLKELNKQDIDLLYFMVNELLYNHYLNIFPLWDSAALEDFRVNIYLKHEGQHLITNNPNQRDLISFREAWVKEEQVRANQLYSTIENSKDPVNTRVERSVCLGVLKNYIESCRNSINKPTSVNLKTKQHTYNKAQTLEQIWVDKEDASHYKRVLEFLKLPDEKTKKPLVKEVDGCLKWVGSIVLLGTFVNICKRKDYIDSTILDAEIQKILGITFSKEGLLTAKPLRSDFIPDAKQKTRFADLPKPNKPE